MDDVVRKAICNIEQDKILEEESETPDSNYQCGDCGYITETEENVNQHVSDKHTEDVVLCSMCQTYKNEIVVLRNKMVEQEDINKDKESHNDRLIKKNVSLENENKRLKLALKQSETEKQKLKADIESQSEAMNAALKENVVLNETLRLKKSLEEVDNESGDDCETETQESTISSEEEILNCTECEFKTKNKKYMKGHKIKHTGQYMCQQGCRSAFKTVNDLDRHIQSTHTNRNPPKQFQCEKCVEKGTFRDIHSVRIHTQKKHAVSVEQECENCGRKFLNKLQFILHRAECTEEFELVNVPLCRYFTNGYCRKGNFCLFSHANSRQNIPICRNGSGCPYKARGFCRFSHPSQEKMNRNQRVFLEPSRSISQSKRCYFMEDCRRAPYCPF